MSKQFINLLSDRKRLINQIEKLYYKLKERGNLAQAQHDGVALYTLMLKKHQLAKLLSKALKQHRFQTAPARQKHIQIKDKTREIFLYPLLDQIINGTAAQLLNDLLQPVNSKNSYAYQPGKQPLNAVTDFENYLKQNPQGVYLVKTDIENYSDNLPVDEHSPLWPKLEKLFSHQNLSVCSYSWKLLKRIIRPEIISLDGNHYSKLSGMPTGSPICTFLGNLYLHDVDKKLEQYPGSFYARYNDDLLIAHPKKAVIEEIRENLFKQIQLLNLTRNLEKEEQLAFNKAARSEHKDWLGINYLDYLGFRLHASGTHCLSKARQQRLLQLLKERINATLQCNQGNTNIEALGKSVCQSLNHAYCTLPQQDNHCFQLITQSNDRQQLKHLDYLLALYIAYRLSGIKGPKAFKKIPYRRIRNQWGLLSLCQLRNKGLEFYA